MIGATACSFAGCSPSPTSPRSEGTPATHRQRRHRTGSTVPATGELLRANEQLSQEIGQRNGAEESHSTPLQYGLSKHRSEDA